MLKHLITKRMVGATVFFLAFVFVFSFDPVGFVSDAKAQTRATQEQEKPKRAKERMKLQVHKTDLVELSRFCNPQQTTSSTRSGRTTYTCKGNPGGGSMTVQADPDVAKATINCDYSDNNGTMTWLGCSCTGDDNGDCIGFINNCLEAGDTVEGNSGSANCSPGE